MRVRNAESGMTLVELLAVIILIALIGGIVVRGVFHSSDVAKAKLNEVRMAKVQAALQNYRLDFNRYPGQLQDLLKPNAEVARSGKAFFAYATPEDLQDVWGADFVYRTESDNRAYTLMTLGADGKEGGTDQDQDISLRP